MSVPEEPEAGVLIMRVEQQDEYVLITVTIDRTLGRGQLGAPPDQQLRLTDRDEALRAVTAFLDSF